MGRQISNKWGFLPPIFNGGGQIVTVSKWHDFMHSKLYWLHPNKQTIRTNKKNKQKIVIVGYFYALTIKNMFSVYLFYSKCWTDCKKDKYPIEWVKVLEQNTIFQTCVLFESFCQCLQDSIFFLCIGCQPVLYIVSINLFTLLPIKMTFFP